MNFFTNTILNVIVNGEREAQVQSFAKGLHKVEKGGGAAAAREAASYG
ncbi:hypothetical protein EmuJ_001186400 [Echinococcus multilocularis]|uniref:Uncharacterized protein n=1 Tax=Echinococcus multilocularis TaxID=6211 RepID=A0A068Y0M3_ECHMU|nr:hypothetical protein EmuJ_001186400 [Echinococcus multilocularis]